MLPGKAAEAAVQAIGAKTVENAGSPAWLVVSSLIGALVMITVAFFKILPVMRKITAEARRDEMASMSARIEKLEGLIDNQATAIKEANDRANQSQMKANTLAAAVELLLGEVRRLDPSSPIIENAQRLVTISIEPDGLFNDALRKLSTVPATGHRMRKILDSISRLQVRDLIAIFLVNEFAAALFYALSYAFPKQNEQLVTYMLGQLSGFVGTAIALYFGASRNDEHRAEKDRELTQTLAETAKAVATSPTGAQGDPLHTVDEGKAE